MVEATRRRGFVGRATELARLDQALASAGDGSAGVVVVGGEAGIGKTALIERFLQGARTRGVHVLGGACLPVGYGSLPYLPFVEALRALVRSTEPGRLPALLGPRRSDLGRLLPELESPTRPNPDVEDDPSAQSRLFELVLGVLDRLARSGPVLVVVEDVQWADRSTLDLAAFLVRNLRSAPILFVLSARSDELGPGHPALGFLAELERGGALRLELPPLTRDEVRRLVEDRLGGRPADELLETIAARTSGNPFFAEQLIAASEEAGPGPAPLPPALRDVLAARLAALPASTRRVLRVAAAAGRRTDDALIALVSGLPPAEVADALRDAVGRGLLVEADAGPDAGPRAVPDGLGGYAFRHALVQEVAYRELLPGERTALHAAWGRTLAERGEVGGEPVAPGEIAYHWVAARNHARALPALVEAAVDGERVFAFAEALAHFEAALRLWPSVPGADELVGRDRVWALIRAAECAVLSGAADRAVELGREAVAELATSGSAADDGGRRLGELHGRLRWFLWEAGDRAGAVAALEEALRFLPESSPSRVRARALAQLAGARLLSGRYEEAERIAESALSTARAASGIAEEALALGVLGWSRAVLGDIDAGERTFREGLAIAVRLGGAEGIALAYANLAALLDRVGRTESALLAAQDGIAIVDRLGLARTYGGTLIGHAAKALFNLGRWDEAEATLQRGLALEPVGPAAAWIHVNRARLDTNRGDFETAEAHLVAATSAGTLRTGELPHATAVLAARAELATWRRDLTSVRAMAAEGLRRAEAIAIPDPWLAWLAALALRAEADAVEVARARRDEAALNASAAAAATIEGRLGAFAGVARGVRDGAVLALCRGELGRLRGRSSVDAWQAAAEAWTGVGRPYAVAYARFRAAEAVLMARGPRNEAEVGLREAATIARGLGARPLLGEIERLARQARLDVDAAAGVRAGAAASASGGVAAGGVGSDTEDGSRAGETTVAGLTSREAEVLALVAAGWTNQQIADALFITRKTASVHVSNILGKLGAANRVEAAAIAHRLGLDQPAAPS